MIGFALDGLKGSRDTADITRESLCLDDTVIDSQRRIKRLEHGSEEGIQRLEVVDEVCSQGINRVPPLELEITLIVSIYKRIYHRMMVRKLQIKIGA